ncbi:CCHC-type zinc finger nucleic acid binding protein-like [Gordionus sp. m RMFG-2023]|uniref:CCHC-type zinc finger nucleic acid binding protein-like n=1 Tax=Gordionus sp. m RMFG-2023 TaxID=3053472 RepID=UPI0031FE0C6E
MVRDCLESKCFKCGKYGHISPYCPKKQDKLRCAGCGRYGHSKEDCNVTNFNTRGGFPQRDMGQNPPNIRIIEQNKIYFRCIKDGHVARYCEFL